MSQRLKDRPFDRYRAFLFFICNAALFGYIVQYLFCRNDFLLSITIGLIVFFIPGITWIGVFSLRESPSPLRILLRTVALSLLVLVLSQLFHVCAGIDISALTEWFFLLIAGNVGILFSKKRTLEMIVKSIFGARRQSVLMGTAVFVAAYLLFYTGATRIVPPLSDQDMEMQQSAYGVIKRLVPDALLDVGLLRNFLHPQLLFVYNAHTILLWGEIEQLRYYEDYLPVGKRIVKTRPRPGMTFYTTTAGGRQETHRIISVSGDTVFLDTPVALDAESIDFPELLPGARRIYHYLPRGVSEIDFQDFRMEAFMQLNHGPILEHFLTTPSLLPTRLPNLFFSALAAALLAGLLVVLTSSYPLSFLGTVVYLSFPEVVVRSSYGGYYPITTFLMIVVLRLYLSQKRTPAPTGFRPFADADLFLASLLLALASHKAAILIAGIVGAEVLTRSAKHESLFNPAVWGFAAGTVLFYLYAYVVDAGAFITGHLHYHLVNRICHVPDLGYQGYPSVLQLWKEFIGHMNPLFSLPALALIVPALWNQQLRKMPAVVLPLWSLIGAVVFSVVDWRQTKHLMLIVIPLLATVLFWLSRQKGVLRYISFIIISAVVVINCLICYRLYCDFSFIVPTGGW